MKKITPPQPEQSVESMLLYGAFRQAWLNAWTAIGVAIVGAWIFWPYLPSSSMTAWLLAVLASNGLGVAACLAFKRYSPKGSQLARWDKIFLILAVLRGLGWGLGPALLMWQSTGAASVVLVGTLLCVCAVAMISIAEHKTAMQAFIVAALGPTVVSAFLARGEIENLVGFVLLGGMLTWIGVGRRSAQNIRSALETQVRVQAILDNAQDAVIGMDGVGRISSWNLRAEALFGWPEAEVMGRKFDDILMVPTAWEAPPDALKNLWVAQESGAGRRVEMAMQHRDGTRLPVEIAFTRLFINKGILFTAFIADGSARKAAEEKLALFRRVIDASNQCVVISDARGRGIYQNHAHAQTLGYADSEMAGEHFARALPAEDGAQTMATIMQSVVQSGTWSGPLQLVRKDGSQFMSASNIGSIVDDKVEIQYLFNIFTDITQELARQDELKLAKDNAERANHAKSDFLSNMSHGLRTPLNAILGFAQVLEIDNSLSESQKGSAAEIHTGGRHLLKLVNELLDLAKIESRQLSLALEPVRMFEIVDDCWRLMQPLAIARQLTFHQHVPRSAVVRADRVRLKQVLLNLMSNAIKYNRQSGDIGVRVLPAESGRFRIEVTDTGTGIAPARLPEVFQAFNRLGMDHTAIEGTGIGLSITQQLVVLMGGTVGVESQLGSGTTFWVELPSAAIDVAAPRDEPDGAMTRFDAISDGQCVLAIDDNAANLKLIAQILAKRPHIRLITAQNPGLGIQLAMSKKPTLILLDINMPGMDGYQVIEVLKTYAQTQSIPIIAVTANAIPRDIDKGAAAGLAGYITKPLDVAKFLAAVDRCLEQALVSAS